MIIKAIFAVIFALFFGFVFIWSGIRRILSPLANDKPGESLVWGSVGIGLGIAFLCGVAWLFFGPTVKPPDSTDFISQPDAHGSPFLIDTATTHPVQ